MRSIRSVILSEPVSEVDLTSHLTFQMVFCDVLGGEFSVKKSFGCYCTAPGREWSKHSL